MYQIFMTTVVSVSVVDRYIYVCVSCAHIRICIDMIPYACLYV